MRLRSLLCARGDFSNRRGNARGILPSMERDVQIHTPSLLKCKLPSLPSRRRALEKDGARPWPPPLHSPRCWSGAPVLALDAHAADATNTDFCLVAAAPPLAAYGAAAWCAYVDTNER